MDKKGQVAVLFMIYFIIITSWVAVMEYQVQKQIQVFVNMKVANERMLSDILILDQVECDYINNRWSEESLLNYEMIESENMYQIIYDGLVLNVEIDDDLQRIVDYQIIVQE